MITLKFSPRMYWQMKGVFLEARKMATQAG